MKTPSTIGYANARLRARRQRVFREGDYSVLISASSLDDLVRRLRQTPYASYLDAAALIAKGSDMVGIAAAKYYAAELALVTSMYSTIDRRCIEVFAESQDIIDFKTVVSGKLSGADTGSIIESFVGPGWLVARADLNLMAAQHSIQDALDVALTLKIPYAKVLKRYAPRLIESIRLDRETADDMVAAEFELELDKAYFARALKRLSYGMDRSKIVRWYIRGRIDVSNILIALRCLFAFEEDEEFAQECFIPGGLEIDRELFKMMIQAADRSEQNLQKVLALLKKTQYAPALDKAMTEYGLSGSIVSFEKKLMDYLFKAMQNRGYHDILGLGLPVAYIFALQVETINVRIIAHAKKFRIPEAYVREELLYV